MENVFQLVVVMSAVIWCVWLFLHYGGKWGINEKGGKVHLWYIGGISTFLIMEFVVYLCLGNYERDNIIGTVSFGATLSSLIMSILAIIYTLISGKNDREQLGKIDQATTSLTKVASGLTKFNEIANTIDQKTDDLIKRIEDLRIGQKNTQDQIRDFKERQQKVETNITNSSSVQSLADESKEENISETKLFNQFIENSSYFGCLSILAAKYASETDGKSFNFFELATKLKAENIAHYMGGYIMAANAVGVIVDSKVNLNDNTITVGKVFDGLEKMCIERVYKRVRSAEDEELKKYLLNMFNNLRNYFHKKELNINDLKGHA